VAAGPAAVAVQALQGHAGGAGARLVAALGHRQHTLAAEGEPVGRELRMPTLGGIAGGLQPPLQIWGYRYLLGKE